MWQWINSLLVIDLLASTDRLVGLGLHSVLGLGHLPWEWTVSDCWCGHGGRTGGYQAALLLLWWGCQV